VHCIYPYHYAHKHPLAATGTREGQLQAAQPAGCHSNKLPDASNKLQCVMTKSTPMACRTADALHRKAGRQWEKMNMDGRGPWQTLSVLLCTQTLLCC
jgi:hypothetical protein